jgi:hypothetical protein
MGIGQASGIVAAIAALHQGDVSNVTYAEFQTYSDSIMRSEEK